jgi:hypothetical protein
MDGLVGQLKEERREEEEAKPKWALLVGWL